MANNHNLVCPIRGPLDATYFSKDGLTITEEARRIDCIKFLLTKNYPADNFHCETTVIKYVGNQGRNSLRADVVIYDIPSTEVKRLDDEERNKHVLLVAEIKRDSKSKKSGIASQLEPAMRQSDRIFVIGVYWDDINRQKEESYPIEWIFHVLRTEETRIQFWTESGGTSYGKLTVDHDAGTVLLSYNETIEPSPRLRKYLIFLLHPQRIVLA